LTHSSPAAVDLLVVGELNPDLVVRDADPRPVFGDVEKLVDHASLEVGSSSAICACGAARLGIRTALVAVVGNDLFGRHMLDQMSARGVDVAGCIADESEATGISIVLTRASDRAILTFPGAIGRLRADDVPRPLLERVRHLHVGSYFLLDDARPGLPRLFDDARRLGITTSLDCNWDPADDWDGGLIALLKGTDLFFCNAEEALRITRATNARTAAQALARHAGVAVVKMGRRGALAASGSEVVEVGAPTVEPVDTIGAGDSFDAGFLSQWIWGRPIDESLRVGVACGALSTRGPGGTSRQPTLDEALALAHALLVDD
jgi:sugar/nucleoside kinase (ribokinase family)